MALVDFYQRSLLFNLPPPDLRFRYGFWRQSAIRFVADDDPTDVLRYHSVFVDTQTFIQSIPHTPANRKSQWEPVIRVVKRNPDFVGHYLQHFTFHRKHLQPAEESDYESLVFMHDATLRVAFPTNLGPPCTPPPPMQSIHIVDDGTYCILNDGSSIL